MQQIINFLIKNKNFLLFLLLLGISFLFTVQSHSYHRSKFVNSANFLTGGMYDAIGGSQEYFHLKEYNRQLMVENARFRESVTNHTPIATTDTTALKAMHIVADSSQQFVFIPAQVINNNYSKTDNFITIRGGRKDSIQQDMGVITSNGIVGIIDKTSTRYSTVLSLLNTNFTTSAQLKNSYHFGTIQWKERDPNKVQLSDIPSQANITIGDTIITSGRSAIFPKGIAIGNIDSYELDASENFYTITVNLFNDMRSLGHVYVIKNSHKEEILTLEAASNEQ